jgi:hypothetical protein
MAAEGKAPKAARQSETPYFQCWCVTVGMKPQPLSPAYLPRLGGGTCSGVHPQKDLTVKTRLAFKAAHACELQEMYGWARDHEKLIRSLKIVDRALAGRDGWHPESVAANAAWLAIGGKPTLEALRGLPEGKGRPPEFN